MLTLFSTPKPFEGHIGIIQRNALTSWKRLHPEADIILFGDEQGTQEVCQELGLRHEPDVERTEDGPPSVRSLFGRAQEISRYPLLCYSNCDIILRSDFLRALQAVSDCRREFLMVGRRWDLDRDRPIDFDQAGWVETIRGEALRANVQRPGNYIDYFVFPRGLFTGLLPLAIGRFSWDNYLLWCARSRGAELVDASLSVLAIHQNHDYSHYSGGTADIREGPERKRNREMVGPWWRLYTIEDATQILTAEGARPCYRHTWLMMKRLWSHPLTIVQWPWFALRSMRRT